MPSAEGRTLPFVGPEHVDVAVLETFGYDGPEQEIVTETSEFTAVCPYSGLPDFARLTVTYVPARNTVLLALALGWAEVLGAFDLYVGVNAVDYSGYPDCRPEFIAAFERLANLATRAGVEGRGEFRIHAILHALRERDAHLMRECLRDLAGRRPECHVVWE